VTTTLAPAPTRWADAERRNIALIELLTLLLEARTRPGKALKYSEDQPREPAGTTEGGRFAPASGSDASPSAPPAAGAHANKAAVHARLDAEVARAKLPPEMAALYQQAARQAIDAMPQGFLDAFAQNLGVVDFVENTNKVNERFAEITGSTPAPADRLAGFTAWHGSERTSLVVVDGAMGEGTAFHIYAHEFSHVVDGPERLGKAISSTPGWRVAWDTEINTVAADGGRPITAYATWGPIEGFAEYGRMVLMHPKAAREDFPESWAVWKAHGLV
jgi:hypothetical protein